MFSRNGFSSLFRPRRSLKERFIDFLRDNSALNRLILINISIYLLFVVLRFIFYLVGYLFLNDTNFAEILILFISFPADVTSFLYHPWTIITSIFSHASLGHIFFNMLMLYVAGKIFLQYLTNKQLWITYFVGGVCGNLLYMFAYNIFPVLVSIMPQAIVMGASGAIMAVLFAIAIYRPNHSINLILIGSIKLKWIALIFIVIDLVSITSNNAGGHIAHLGGAIYGSLMALCLLLLQAQKSKPKKVKTKFYSSRPNQARPMSDADYNAQKRQQEEKLDIILDKVARDGYASLSKEEKDFLFFYRKK